MATLATLLKSRPDLTERLKTMNMFHSRAYEFMNVRPIDVPQWMNLFAFLNPVLVQTCLGGARDVIARNVIIWVDVKVFNTDTMMAAMIFLRQVRWSDGLGYFGSVCIQSTQKEQMNRSTPGYKNPLVLYDNQLVKTWDP
jgi:hypothetical protein